MALVLKRITNPYECVRCNVTRKIISYGEEYYEDDDDGFIVDFNYYYDTKLAMKRDEAMPLLEASMDRFGYQQQLIQRQRDFLRKTMFDRPLAGEDCTSWDGYNSSFTSDFQIEDKENISFPTMSQDNDEKK